MAGPKSGRNGKEDAVSLHKDQQPVHEPVMVEEVLRGLQCRAGGFYVDGTVGEGGHAEAILRRTDQRGELWGLDRNPTVLEVAAARLAPFTSQFRLFHASYAELGDLLQTRQPPQASGVLLDLGLSLYLLKRSGRGFSFLEDEPLDMRFDPTVPGPTAAWLLSHASRPELERIFRDLGEEPRARLLARVLVERRRRQPIATARELAEAVKEIVGGKGRREGQHPATRVFQALRLAVNRELDELKAFLHEAPDWLESGGRLVIISYHSLEDRLVKEACLRWERAGSMRRLTKKPLTPGPGEVSRNPRARSAKLRVAEKV
jgi:16S rRNA (cytosine1402-N4)-methyltransferase